QPAVAIVVEEHAARPRSLHDVAEMIAAEIVLEIDSRPLRDVFENRQIFLPAGRTRRQNEHSEKQQVPHLHIPPRTFPSPWSAAPHSFAPRIAARLSHA